MSATVTIGLALAPLDVLFFRDGRPFEGGTRAVSGEPQPQTLAGAVRTHLLERAGRDFGVVRQALLNGEPIGAALGEVAGVSVRGPWLAQDGEPLLPAPATLRQVKGADPDRLVRLDPLKDGLPPLPIGLLPLWARCGDRLEPAGGWLTLAGMAAFLAGSVPRKDQLVARDALFALDQRTGIVIGEGGTTEEGLIYAADYLALRPGVSLLAEVTGPASLLEAAFGRPVALPFGGQGRRVEARRCPPVAWPRPPAGGAGRLVVLTSPAPFPEGWRPPGLALAAAAVPGHVAVSGWDLARGGPKPTRFAVPAGAVFFLDPSSAAPAPGSLLDGEDAAVGWGSHLSGVWNYA